MRPGPRGWRQVSRIVWFTNLNAPYRHPVWLSLSSRGDFAVGLLGKNEPNRFWSNELPPGVQGVDVHAKQFSVYGAIVYLLARPGLLNLEPRDCAVLPGWENPAAWQLRLLAMLRGIGTVAFYESTESSNRFRRGPLTWARRWFLRHCGSVLTVGQASTDAVRRMGVAPERIVMAHNSVDLDLFRWDAAGEPSASQLDHQHRARRFVYVGQLISRKNVEGLLESVAACDRDLTLSVVGDGPNRLALIQLTESLGLLGRVDFVGHKTASEVRDILSQNSTLVLPSTEEVFGLAPVEALAHGLQVIVSDRCGVAADIEGMPGVRIVRPNIAEIARAIGQSVDAWEGPIREPPVLQWTAERFADDLLRAVDIARSRRRFRLPVWHAKS